MSVDISKLNPLEKVIATSPVGPKPNNSTQVSTWLNEQDIKELAARVKAVLVNGE